MKKIFQFFWTLHMLVIITNSAYSAETKTRAESYIQQNMPTTVSSHIASLEEQEPIISEINDFKAKALSKNTSPLTLAIKGNNIPMMRYFIKHEPDSLNMLDEATGDTPLIDATVTNNLPAMNLLLDTKGIQINKANKDGKTAAHMANLYLKAPVAALQLLEKYGVDFSIFDKKGYTPIDYFTFNLATYSPSDDKTIQFIQDHRDLFTNARGNSLHIAATFPEALAAIIAAGIDLTQKDINEYTLLRYAVERSLKIGLQILLMQPTVKQTLHTTEKELLTDFIRWKVDNNAEFDEFKDIAIWLRLAGATSHDPSVAPQLAIIDKVIAQSKAEARAVQQVLTQQRTITTPDILKLIDSYIGAPEPTESEKKVKIVERRLAEQFKKQSIGCFPIPSKVKKQQK